eukprot:9160151-Pyramimonas_sp.AAC.1
MHFDDNTVIQGTKIQDQPTGCNCTAPLPNGVTHIRSRLGWESPAPVLIGQEASGHAQGGVRASMAIVSPPLRLSAAAWPPL